MPLDDCFRLDHDEGFSPFLVLLIQQPVYAGTITFSEQPVLDLLTHTYVGPSGTMLYSDTLSNFSLVGVQFTPTGNSSPGTFPNLILRTTFDNRSPAAYPYDFISENVMQISSTGLRLDFSVPSSSFGFGAALNATSSLSSMLVQLFDSQDQSLGAFTLTLDRTVLSSSGGTNSNSEGQFFISNLPGISYATISNFGDGSTNGSQYNWVIDNVTTAPIPEPTSLLLLGTGLGGIALATWRRRK
jgi:hypothetical protein